LDGVSAVERPSASYGAMREVSKGKDTTTGHWEIAGLEIETAFRVFPKEPPSFPAELTSEFEKRTGRKIAGNKAASGTLIIEELGRRQIEEGCWIVYTSADSVFQIAAHERIIPLNELYEACEIARELCNDYRIGRVIARPYVGEPGAFSRTENRRDYSFPLPEPTILDRLSSHGIGVTTVGKLDDVFNGQGISRSIHVENSRDAQSAVLELALEQDTAGLVFVNLIDFDMLYGHRRDVRGYARALEDADVFVGKLLVLLKECDLLLITADHGNDPTFAGTDHTREFVPLLSYRRGSPGRNLGVRNGFYDIAQSLAEYFEIGRLSRGKSFI
jgi:phosphopentomutase